MLRHEIFSNSLQEAFKENKMDFTRTRKQSFSTTLLFMMNLLSRSFSIEIENFVDQLRNSCNVRESKSFTKSAFVQYRKKISPKIFTRLSALLVSEFYSDNEIAIKRWNGFRVLVVDGSSIALPFTTELKNTYGEAKNQTDTSIVQARVSVLYDVLNHYVIDSVLSPNVIGERTLVL